MLKNKEPPIFYFLKGKKRKFVRIDLLVETFFACVFFETKNIHSHTHLTYEGGKVIKKFSPGRFPETRLHFFGAIKIFFLVLSSVTLKIYINNKWVEINAHHRFRKIL